MEHWLWQLRWRQGPLSMHDYKERDCSHRSVAFAYSNLDAPAACPRTCTKRTPNSPCPLYRCGIMLLGYTQAVFAVLQLERNSKERSHEVRRMKTAKRKGAVGKSQKGRGTDRVSTWNRIHGTGSTSICSLVLWCWSGRNYTVKQMEKRGTKKTKKKTFHG